MGCTVATPVGYPCSCLAIALVLLRESTDLRQGQGTYPEGGTHGETLHPQSKADVGTRDKGARSQLRQVADL